MYAQAISSNFLHHEPCPKCNSTDNLGRWSDGHAFCFGCGYYEPAERKMNDSSTESVQPIPRESSGLLAAGWATTIAPKALRWLRKYGITAEEIRDNDLRYDSGGGELILPLEIPAGSGTYQRRYFGPHKDVPKYLTTGPRSHSRIFGTDSNSRVACMVEGVIDAVKVGRVCRSYPILGSDPSQEAIKRLLSSFDRVVVWLDRDMFLRASRAVLRASMAYGGAKVSRITADLDPKCYSINEIKEILDVK